LAIKREEKKEKIRTLEGGERKKKKGVKEKR